MSIFENTSFASTEHINDKTLPTQKIYVRVRKSFVLRFSRLHANLGGPSLTNALQCLEVRGWLRLQEVKWPDCPTTSATIVLCP